MDTAKLMAALKAKKADLKQKDKTIKPQPGANRYILLPGWRKGEEHVWWHEFGQHFIKNAAGEIQAVYPCAEATFGKTCEVCDTLNHAAHAATDDETIQLLKDAKASRRYLMNVLALDGEDPKTPAILEVSPTVFSALVDAVEEWAASIFDPEGAQIITITREGKGLNTKYAVQVSPKKVKIPETVYEKLNDLDEYVKMESEEKMRKAIGAINSVAGLAAPASDRPSTTTSRLSAPKAAPADDFVDISEKPAVVKGGSGGGAAALDEELDNLLEGLE